MEPLVTVADLSAIGASFPDDDITTAQIAAASAAIREAAGTVIAPVTTSEITVTGSMEQWLAVPVPAVREVVSVTVDGKTVTDWKLRDGRLWRSSGWGGYGGSDVVATIRHGQDKCPPDLVPLVASLVAAQVAAAKEGFDPKRGMSYERIDDYQYGLRTGGDEILSPLELTDRTRTMLANRYGGGVYVTGSY